MASIAVQNKDYILAQLRQGRMLKEIAAEFGICKTAISNRLTGDPEYAEALREQSESMIQEAKIETWAAREPVDIARAREIAKFAFRYAESINPEKWSPQSKLMVEHTGDLGDRLRRAKERTVQGQRVDTVAELPNGAALQPDNADNADSE